MMVPFGPECNRGVNALSFQQTRFYFNLRNTQNNRFLAGRQKLNDFV